MCGVDHVQHKTTSLPCVLALLNLCTKKQKTRALQVSCHIPVFPRALMENSEMEWVEIYGVKAIQGS